MFGIWLMVCVIWGLWFGDVPTVAWLLLIPFFYQDVYDGINKRRI